MIPPADLARAVARLDAWLETMRQPGGYGGPVAHWWQNRLHYGGPGLDWRYEGILVGYARLYEGTGEPRFLARLEAAAGDLEAGQLADGSYRASRFEINPGALGTPHEAAATLGLLHARPHLRRPQAALEVARRNLEGLVAALRDGAGFADRPHGTERVPNKLATLAHAALAYADTAGDERFVAHAERALDDVLRYQLTSGGLRGAIHQYAPAGGAGDGRFFPYYAARCVPPLVAAHRLLGASRYLEAAHGVLRFLGATMEEDGSWPQVVYRRGKPARWPRWIAGSADILLAYLVLDVPPPEPALARLLASQRPSGAFPTATGFASQVGQRPPSGPPEYRDLLPVVGWNDKALRLLAHLLPPGTAVPPGDVAATRERVSVGDAVGELFEDAARIELTLEGRRAYAWPKRDVYAAVDDVRVGVM